MRFGATDAIEERDAGEPVVGAFAVLSGDDDDEA